MASSNSRRLATAVLSALALLAAGCGGPSDRPELGTVSGVVTLDGKPLPRATVIFNPEKGRPSEGLTDESGRYELSYMPDAPGAAVGRHTVSIRSGGSEQSAEYVGEREVAPAAAKLPERYQSGSELTADVKSGENTIDFPLTSQ